MSRYLGLLGLCAFVGLMGAAKDKSPSWPLPGQVLTQPAGAPTSRPTVYREPRQSGVPQPTRICCDVFKLMLPYKQGVDFSLEQVREYSQSGKALLEALDRLGDPELVYSFEETTDLGSRTSLVESQKVPIVMSVTIVRGVAQPQVTYLDKACRLTVLGQWGGDGSSPEQADVSIVFSLRSVDQSPLGVGGGVKAPVTGHFEIGKSLRVISGRPVLSACFDLQRPQPGGGEDAAPQQLRVYIVRFQLDRLTEAK
jgi:hypothetical protein